MDGLNNCKYNVALIPDSAFIKRTELFAKSIGEKYETDFTASSDLTSPFQPHISMYKFVVSAEEGPKVVAALENPRLFQEKALNIKFNITTLGMTQMKGYIFYNIDNYAPLVSIQENIAMLLRRNMIKPLKRYLQLNPPTKASMPHITVCRMKNESDSTKVLDHFKTVLESFSIASIQVYREDIGAIWEKDIDV